MVNDTKQVLAEYYYKTLGLPFSKQLSFEDDEAYETETFDKDAGLVEEK